MRAQESMAGYCYGCEVPVGLGVILSVCFLVFSFAVSRSGGCLKRRLATLLCILYSVILFFLFLTLMMILLVGVADGEGEGEGDAKGTSLIPDFESEAVILMLQFYILVGALQTFVTAVVIDHSITEAFVCAVLYGWSLLVFLLYVEYYGDFVRSATVSHLFFAIVSLYRLRAFVSHCKHYAMRITLWHLVLVIATSVILGGHYLIARSHYRAISVCTLLWLVLLHEALLRIPIVIRLLYLPEEAYGYVPTPEPARPYLRNHHHFPSSNGSVEAKVDCCSNKLQHQHQHHHNHDCCQDDCHCAEKEKQFSLSRLISLEQRQRHDGCE